MTEPAVDVIIPVHTDERPIARAVESVLAGTRSAVRVNVVCHNVGEAPIAVALGRWADDPRLRLLQVSDGLGSPAGPINFGLDAATAEFTALLDSDDTYESGAVDAWMRVQSRDDAEVVIPMFKYANGISTRTPPTRPFRSKRLDGARDRLAYRTRQHGLISRARFPDLRMTPGLRSGEDVIQGAAIWYSNARISLARGTPAYRIHEDGGERASASVKPAAESLAFLDIVLDPGFLDTLTADQRESLAVKLLRTHVMDVLAGALDSGAEELPVVAAASARIVAVAPRALAILSPRDASILSVLVGSNADPAKLRAEVAVRTDYRRPRNLLPASLRHILNREAPLRFLAATALSP